MFAVVYFYDDKSVDIVNKTKIRSTSSNVHVGAAVQVEYETEDIDESGRDIRRLKDYEGLVLCLERDKAGAQSFLSDNEEQILAKGKQGKDDIVAWAKELIATEEQCQGRKRKKTAKLLEMESELLEDQEISRQRSSLKKKATENKPERTCKKVEISAKKTSAKGKTAETQKIQTMEYFRKKKDVAERKGTAASTAATPQKVQCSPFQESSQSQSPQTTPRTPRRISPISLSCETTSPLQIQQRRTSPRIVSKSQTSNQAGLTQKISTKKSLELAFSAYPSQLSSFSSNDSRSLDMPDASMDIAQVVSQGYSALYGCNNIVCEEKVKHLEEENERLKTELLLKSSNALKGEDQAPLLICQLRNLIDRWEREHQATDQYPSANNSLCQIPDTSLANQDYCVQQTPQYSWSPIQAYKQSLPSVYSSQQLLPLVQASPLSQSSVQASQCSMFPVHSKNLSHPMSLSHSLSPLNATNMGTNVAKRMDMDECDFSHFFQEGEGKIKLAEGHNLFINATKLALIRKKCKKSDSKTIKALLDYYFTPAFLSQHSATGEKSEKPPLPGEILNPIKDFVFQHFKSEPAIINSMINRKCLDSKRKISK